MRLRFALLLLLPALLLAQVASAGAETRILRVGVYRNPPLLILGEDGGISGICAELLEAIAEAEN